MSSLDHSFEQGNNQILENFEEIDLTEWKMEDNEEVVCEDTFEEIDTSPTKLEPQQVDQSEEEVTTEYLDLDLEVDAVPDTEDTEYYPIPPKPRRGRRKKIETKSQSQTSLLKSNYSNTAELKLGPKYRPIRPKPYQPSVVGRNKMLGISSAVNVSTLNPPNRFIVTTPLPCKDKIRDSAILSPNSKANNYVKPFNGSVSNTALVTKGNANDKTLINSSPMNIKKDLRTAKTQNRSSKGSIELFFESMAQTVLNLPMHVQAEIKMEICKLVTMAEIKYSSSQSKQNYKNT